LTSGAVAIILYARERNCPGQRKEKERLYMKGKRGGSDPTKSPSEEKKKKAYGLGPKRKLETHERRDASHERHRRGKKELHHPVPIKKGKNSWPYEEETTPFEKRRSLGKASARQKKPKSISLWKGSSASAGEDGIAAKKAPMQGAVREEGNALSPRQQGEGAIESSKTKAAGPRDDVKSYRGKEGGKKKEKKGNKSYTANVPEERGEIARAREK